MSTARSGARGRVWLRIVVLLLALLVPGAHAQAHALPVAVTVEAEAVEHDALDTALRPPARSARRAGAPLAVRPCPVPPSPPAPAAGRAVDRPVAAPHVPPLPDTVVLRC
ncbi:hypothetical protein ACWDRX_17120 [Streptomyces nigra]|uniref:hypothetical protein n=1 Tax=Streptomyces nigra TaxID=1827580 RepID=UPI0036346EC3